MPPQLYSNMPEEQNRKGCFRRSSHVPLCASLGESGKRAKLSVNGIRMNTGSGEAAWSLLQVSPCSQPLSPAETWWYPRSWSPRCAYSTYGKPLDFTPSMPGGRRVRATTGKTGLQI